jgi:hypothetical protein
MRNPRATLVAAPTVLVVALTAPAAAPAATVSPPVIQAVAQDAQRDLLDPEIRGALAAQVKASLRHDVLAAWYPRVEDREAGGFLGGFDHAWRRPGPPCLDGGPGRRALS